MRLNFSRTVRPACSSQPPAFHSRRSTQTSAEVFLKAKSAVTNFRVIGLLTEDGRVFEQAEIEQRFSKRATEMGAAALIMLPPTRKIAAPDGWSSFDTFRYCAAVLSCA